MTYELIGECYIDELGSVSNTCMLCINGSVFLKHDTPAYDLYILNDGLSLRETVGLAHMTNEQIAHHVENVITKTTVFERPGNLYWKLNGLSDGSRVYKFYKTRETYDRNMTLTPIKYKGVIRIVQIHPKPSNTILFNYFVLTNNDKKICDLLNRYDFL